jgi:mycofactocin system FadH/OYE family oxidoreductase 2
MSQQFPHLFAPITIGNVTIRNRIFTPPYGTNLVETEEKGWWRRLARFHEERAKGGVGLIVTSDVVSHPTSHMYRITAIDERHIPFLREVADRVHQHGAKIFQMIHHTGRQTKSEFSRLPLWAPSPLRGPFSREIPHEMEPEEINEIIGWYARTAKIMQEAGYDGVELQGAHGFLLASFLSPASNRRTDEYGGSLENRLRFPLRVIEAIRNACGKDFVLGSTLSGDELNPQGLTIEGAQDIARALEAHGGLNYLSVRIGDYGAVPVWIGDMSVPRGRAIHIGEQIRGVLKRLPVLCTLRVKDPVHAEEILAAGRVDMVGMGRATLADPELVRKAQEGRLADIRPCIACNQLCITRVRAGLPIGCVVNPSVTEEELYGLGVPPVAATKKTVVVVGGGPAGLKAAEMAALRGHRVVLFEKDRELGGQINLAARIPGREEIADAIRYLIHRVHTLGVDLRIGQEATVHTVLAEKPHTVIAATGSTPALPPISGADQLHVYTVHQMLNGMDIPGKRVVIVDSGDGHWKFAGAAEYLAGQGKEVILVTPAFMAGADIPESSIPLLYGRLFSRGAEVIPTGVVKSITDHRVTLVNVYGGPEQVLDGVDAVVVATDGQVETTLYRQLKGKVSELHLIGDARAPRKLDSAIREAFRVGWKL